MNNTYFVVNGEFVKATKWMIFKRTVYNWINRFKLVDSWKYRLIPYDDIKYYFKLSPKEYEDSEKIYKEKGTISYEFYPNGGIGWGVRIKVIKTGDVFDVTDVNSW